MGGLDLCIYRDLCPNGEDRTPALGGDWNLVTGDQWMPVLTVAGGKDWVQVGSGDPHPQCRSHIARSGYPDHWTRGDIYGNALLCCPQTGLSSPSPVTACPMPPLPAPPSDRRRRRRRRRSPTPSKEEEEKEVNPGGIGVLATILTIL